MRVEEQIEREFLRVPLRPRTMLYYSVRKAILESVTAAARSFSGTVLDVGCGFMPYREVIESVPGVHGYIGIDVPNSPIYGDVKPSLRWNGNDIPLEDESVDCVMATEFLEHHAEPDKILAEIYRVTKRGGKFFATVPFVWNLHEIPNDEYRFTPYSLERHIRKAGFTSVDIRALGGWNWSLAQMIGLWVTFSNISSPSRAVLRNVLFPFYALLIWTDRKPSAFDGSGNSMFSGLSVLAAK